MFKYFIITIQALLGVLLATLPAWAQTTTVPPVSGTKTVVRNYDEGGNAHHLEKIFKFYRDRNGRTRASDNDGMVYISDPIAKRSYIINDNAGAHTYLILDGTLAQARTSNTVSMSISTLVTDLGTTNYYGQQVTRKRYRVGYNANSLDVEIWNSKALYMPMVLSITSTDPDEGNYTEYYQVAADADPDSSLFTVPAGYTLVTASHESMLAALPNSLHASLAAPLLMTSVRRLSQPSNSLFASGLLVVNIPTSSGGTFSTDRTVSESPLLGIPLTSLSATTQVWRFKDSGAAADSGPAFGVIESTIYKPDGSSVKASNLIVLDIFTAN
jgi:hypothetical protein